MTMLTIWRQADIFDNNKISATFSEKNMKAKKVKI